VRSGFSSTSSGAKGSERSGSATSTACAPDGTRGRARVVALPFDPAPGTWRPRSATAGPCAALCPSLTPGLASWRTQALHLVGWHLEADRQVTHLDQKDLPTQDADTAAVLDDCPLDLLRTVGEADASAGREAHGHTLPHARVEAHPVRAVVTSTHEVRRRPRNSTPASPCHGHPRPRGVRRPKAPTLLSSGCVSPPWATRVQRVSATDAGVEEAVRPASRGGCGEESAGSAVASTHSPRSSTWPEQSPPVRRSG
jgi:hypothetical protein